MSMTAVTLHMFTCEACRWPVGSLCMLTSPLYMPLPVGSDDGWMAGWLDDWMVGWLDDWG